MDYWTARAELDRHKDVAREGAFERACLLARKAKAWIVIGMPYNDDDLLTSPAQQIQALTDRLSTDACR